jgi:2-succinyl-5-enolpyruvyl-6-hydroxy-3-cyclohexene-1-carboxylate synthase
LIYAGHLEQMGDDLAEAVTAASVATGYPVISEATSRLRGRLEGAAAVVDAAEAMVRSDGFEREHRPEAVIRIGRAPLTRRMQEWLDGSGAWQVVVSDEVPWSDPGRAASEIQAADPAEGLRAIAGAVADTGKPDAAWSKAWAESGAIAREAIDSHLDDGPMFEGTVVRSVARSLPADALLYIGTSLPIRAPTLFIPQAIDWLLCASISKCT